MREILFRGKRIDDGEWVYGDLIICGTKYYYIKPRANFVKVENNIGKTTVMREVVPETVGQYTGLTDRNGNDMSGKKIFEGDILRFVDERYGYKWIGKIEFGNPNSQYDWGFQAVYISGEKANTDILLWVDMEEIGAFCEVIGNIHDNPELVRGEEE